jgi:hypothetical protein
MRTDDSRRHCGWCHTPIPAFVRRIGATLRLPHPPEPGSEVEDLVIDGHPVTATVPQPGSFYADKGDVVVMVCGDACRQALERAVDNDARAHVAAHEPSQTLGQRIRERTVPCSWCGGRLRRDRMPYIAPLKLPPAPELAGRQGAMAPLPLGGAIRHGYISGVDPVTKVGQIVFVLCSAACGAALCAGLVEFVAEVRRPRPCARVVAGHDQGRRQSPL